MLAFRKWFLVLALVTLTAALASAQTPVAPGAFQCTANAGVPPLVRAEGIAELVGDLVLNCTGGYPAGFVDITGSGPASIPQINVQIFLNTNITSKLLDVTNNFSEALLMIDDPKSDDQKVCVLSTTATCAVPTTRAFDPGNVYKPVNLNPYNVWQGRQAGDNSIAWLGIPIDAPGSGRQRIIRMTNVRANANQLGVSSTLVPTQIVAFISATGTTSIPINNPQQTVAWIQKGLADFRIRNNKDDGGKPNLNQCAGSTDSRKDLFTDPTKSDKYCANGRMIFEEGFASAWKTRFSGSSSPWLSGPNQNAPGQIFTSSESGFFVNSHSGWGSLAFAAGVATQGTRLRVAFNNVPAGLRLYVSEHPFKWDSAVNDAILVNTAQDGSGAFSATPTSFYTATKDTRSCDFMQSTAGGVLYRFAEVPIFGGSGVAVWEITATDPLAVQRMDFGFVVAYVANTPNNLPAIGTATANGMFAPISTVTKASGFAAVPRFADTSSAKDVFKIQQCATNLLFPFVSNQAGFDTGMVIANTSKDPWDHDVEAGTCEINYYGDTNGGAAPPKQTSATIPAGDYLAWTLSGGGKFGVTATPGFQGYIIARCKFRWAHGFAFISDVGAQRLSHGYLALVMDSGTNRDDVATSENLGQ